MLCLSLQPKLLQSTLITALYSYNSRQNHTLQLYDNIILLSYIASLLPSAIILWNPSASMDCNSVFKFYICLATWGYFTPSPKLSGSCQFPWSFTQMFWSFGRAQCAIWTQAGHDSVMWIFVLTKVVQMPVMIAKTDPLLKFGLKNQTKISDSWSNPDHLPRQAVRADNDPLVLTHVLLQ